MIFDTQLFWTGVGLSAAAAFVWPRLKSSDYAKCDIDPSCSGKVRGTLNLTSLGTQTKVRCDLRGLSPGLHGLHVHRCGDLSAGCESTCDHYNPENQQHGGPTGPNRHRGDFGNIFVNTDGICTDEIVADVTLKEILGRAFVIHQDEDDLGKGDNAESQITGNAGKRIACGIISLET